MSAVSGVLHVEPVGEDLVLRYRYVDEEGSYEEFFRVVGFFEPDGRTLSSVGIEAMSDPEEYPLADLIAIRGI